MLSLTRRVGESITIGDNVELTVVSVGTQKVRLAFTAPENVEIWRKEIKDKIDKGEIRENR